MALPQIEALDALIEQQQSTLTDPAERDRALADIEFELEGMLSNVSTCRGDAQVQRRGRSGNGSSPKE